jgi:3-oxoacyl-[acyl-carrier-protein] synthase II
MAGSTDTDTRRTALLRRLRMTLEQEGETLSERVEEQLEEIVADLEAGAEPQPQPVRVAPHSANNRVVVTGLGVVSPVGIGVDAYWDSLTHGRSGIGEITLFDTEGFPTRIAGEVKGWNAEDHLDRKQAKRMSRAGQFAVAAAQQAVKDAGLRLGDTNPHVGVLLGTGTSSFPDTEAAMRTLVSKGPMRISPFFAPIALPNMPTGQVAMALKAQGYNNTVVTACAAGTQAVGEAYEAVRRGDADVMLAGGTEAGICSLGLAAFCVMHALSTRNEEPQKASRPYDKDRDGFIPAEGAGILVLESLQHALEREARIYGEVVGFAANSDAYHVVMPEPNGSGAARAIEAALEHAGIQPLEVDYINAHGTSTQLNDAAETAAIKAVFAEYAHSVPISSTKSMMGHLLGAAGAVEAVASVLTLHHDLIPPTINLQNPDPVCDLDYVPNEARGADVRVVMSNSFGFGGQNAVLLMREYQG